MINDDDDDDDDNDDDDDDDLYLIPLRQCWILRHQLLMVISYGDQDVKNESNSVMVQPRVNKFYSAIEDCLTSGWNFT